MKSLDAILATIQPPDPAAVQAAWARWDSIAKPLRSLGLLEIAVARMAGMLRTPKVDIQKRCLAVFCSDNGVVAEGVTQTTQAVTAIVTENFAKGETSVSVMAALANMPLFPVDMGVAADLTQPGILDCKVAHGTKNLAKEPAMTRAEAILALRRGANLALRLSGEGYRLFATGEMGIGNTTTSSAVVSVLLGVPPKEVTGHGAGLSSDGVAHKISVIEKAIALHRPDPADPVDVLCKVGGFDLAGMAGFYLGAAAAGVPVLVDGFISATAALIARGLCPTITEYCIASHVSNEPAGAMVLHALGLTPFLTAQMCLGEGTGAVAAVPILDMAVAVYTQMSTFSDISIDSYQPLV